MTVRDSLEPIRPAPADALSPVVAAVADLLIRHCRPDEIVLFGSRAKGGAAPDSDVDVLVLTRQPMPRPQQDLVRGLFLDFPIGVDVLFRTREEFEAERAKKHSFVHSITLHGVSIHRHAR